MEERKIIIADYDEKVRGVLTTAIEQEKDMKVIATTGNGMELLNLIRKYQPDLVIMDLILPWVDGISVLEKLKKEPSSFQRPKILVLTKLNNEEIIHASFSLGICYYMLKPFHVKVVMERIRQIGEISDWIDMEIMKCPSQDEKEEAMYIADLPQTEGMQENQEENLEKEVIRRISGMGVPHHIKGFRYLKTAIFLCIQDMNRLNGITKDLYPSIAKEYNTTPSRVERAIRHAIEVACSRSKDQMVEPEECFYLMGNHKPTNSEFIAFVADRIRMDTGVIQYK